MQITVFHGPSGFPMPVPKTPRGTSGLMTQSGKDQQLKSPGDAENGSVHCHVIFVTANPTSLRVMTSISFFTDQMKTSEFGIVFPQMSARAPEGL